MRPQYSVEDLKTPAGIERTLRQFSLALGAMVPAVPNASVDLSALVKALAPGIRDQLQSPGGAPLNLTNLLPGNSNSVIIEDSHANRTTLYTPPSEQSLLFWETDRNVVYVSIAPGVLEWHFAAGVFVESFSARPGDLGSTDEGFLFWASDTMQMFAWDGAAWQEVGGGIFPQVVDTVALTHQTADIAATAFVDSDTPGTYRANYYLETTTADAAAGTIEVDITFDDDAGGVSVASAALPLSALGRTSGVLFIQEFATSVPPLVTRGYLFGSSFLVTGGFLVPFTPVGSGIDYSTVSTGIYGTSEYALYMSLERIS